LDRYDPLRYSESDNVTRHQGTIFSGSTIAPTVIDASIRIDADCEPPNCESAWASRGGRDGRFTS
jgi:hypothetical protein